VKCRDAALRIAVDGDAAPVILDGDHVIGRDSDRDPRAMAGPHLSDRALDNPLDHLVETLSFGAAHIHGWPFVHPRHVLTNLLLEGLIDCRSVGLVHVLAISLYPERTLLDGTGFSI